MSLNSKLPISSVAADNADTELGVRRALGLDGNGSAQRHPQAHRPAERFTADHQKRRFIRDGEVPVVMVRGRQDHGGRPENGTLSFAGNRVEAVDTALRLEREARGRAERSLAEAQAMIHDLQTKLGHAALARDEARGAVRQAEIDRQAVESELVTERDAREQAEADRARAYASRDAAVQRMQDMRSAALVHVPVAKVTVVAAPVVVAPVVAAPVVVAPVPVAPVVVLSVPVPTVVVAAPVLATPVVVTPVAKARIAKAVVAKAPVKPLAVVTVKKAIKAETKTAKASAPSAKARVAVSKPIKWWIKAKN